MLGASVRSLAATLLPAMTLFGFGASSALAGPPTPAPLPPTMSSETFAASVSPSNLFDFPCGIGSFTVSFDIGGTAAGPYSGTFEETGTLSYTINPPFSIDNHGTVTGFSANFTITSDTGTVTGRRTMDPSAAPGTISCGRHFRTAGFILSAVPTTYTAVIGTPIGNYRDHGSSMGDLSWSFVQPPLQPIVTTSSLDASFQSALSVPILIVPISMDDCKNGGWQNFPQYTNQGQCVSFVASQGGD